MPRILPLHALVVAGVMSSLNVGSSASAGGVKQGEKLKGSNRSDGDVLVYLTGYLVSARAPLLGVAI